MSNLRHANDYRDLVVYQKAAAVAHSIFELTQSFPTSETYSLTDQVRRSSRSVGAQIAEAWAKRRYEKHFVSKLTDADAEQHETRHWVETARRCGYLRNEQAKELVERLRDIGRMLNAMMEKSALFCKGQPSRVSEDSAEYFANADDVVTDD